MIKVSRQTFEEDPQPEPPVCFCDVQHVAKMAETEALSVASSRAAPSPAEQAQGESCNTSAAAEEEDDWRPKRLVRTVLSSMKCSRDFGRQMAREAKRRRFFEAAGKVFLGDGLPWNWTIWRERFRDFTPILDFIHRLSYLFLSRERRCSGTTRTAPKRFFKSAPPS
ncbi:MAG: hypothetical protein NTY19_05390 [Planctomycetota bacterium]|nr:hypothetical protein [Planctomycetota bacterium]